MSRKTAAAAAAAGCALFLFLATTDSLYAPGATALHGLMHGSMHRWAHAIFGEETSPRFGIRFVLRKFYSVIAFSLIGWLVAVSARGPIRRRYVVAIAVVALFSAIIEVMQKVVAESDESLRSNVFDVVCGALGGAIGAFVTTLRRRR